MADEDQLFNTYIDQLLNGDREIVSNTRTIIARYLYRFGGARASDPENLKAEVFSSLLHNLQRGIFRGENFKQFNAYLRSIVLNTVLKELDAEARHETVPDASSQEPSKIDEFERFATKDLVQFVFKRLNPACRELLRLKYLQDLDNAEIAEKLGLKEVTVRVRIFRCTDYAKQILRDGGLL